MIHFLWPWIFLLLPLPWAVRRLAPQVSRNDHAALRIPFLEDFQQSDQAPASNALKQWPVWLAIAAWSCLVGATARPQWLGEVVELPVTGRDLMLAVDLSQSMAKQDFLVGGRRVDRLTATKWVAGQFIERRKGDRLGLILFGDQAYLQAPLTFDRATINTLLEESVIGLAGRATAIGDAIGLALKRLRMREEGARILVLLTDGRNTAGTDPLQAARVAAEEALTIYTIGIGAAEMLVNRFFGQRRINPSADLDEKTLSEIARLTGGRYFRARDTRELEEIYRLLDQLEPIEQDARSFRPTTALYPWPLAMALGFCVLLIHARIGGRV